MIFFLKKASQFVASPAGDADSESFDKIPRVALIKCEYVEGRNYQNLKRYFAFIRMLFENLDSDEFKNVDVFRKYLEVRAGHGTPVTIGDMAMMIPDSISYESLDEIEFRKLFSRVIDAALKEFPKWTRADMIQAIEREIINFT